MRLIHVISLVLIMLFTPEPGVAGVGAVIILALAQGTDPAVTLVDAVTRFADAATQLTDAVTGLVRALRGE